VRQNQLERGTKTRRSASKKCKAHRQNAAIGRSKSLKAPTRMGQPTRAHGPLRRKCLLTLEWHYGAAMPLAWGAHVRSRALKGRMFWFVLNCWSQTREVCDRACKAVHHMHVRPCGRCVHSLGSVRPAVPLLSCPPHPGDKAMRTLVSRYRFCLTLRSESPTALSHRRVPIARCRRVESTATKDAKPEHCRSALSHQKATNMPHQATMTLYVPRTSAVHARRRMYVRPVLECQHDDSVSINIGRCHRAPAIATSCPIVFSSLNELTGSVQQHECAITVMWHDRRDLSAGRGLPNPPLEDIGMHMYVPLSTPQLGAGI
jgi:hypothetical protein